jgi:hypothetical protein
MTTTTLGAALAVAVALTSCGPTVSVGIAQKRQSKAADDARKYVDQQFAAVQQWMNEQKAGNYTWRPADAYPNETFMQYTDRSGTRPRSACAGIAGHGRLGLDRDAADRAPVQG